MLFWWNDLQNELTKQKIQTIKHPADKDKTDSELAINYAIAKGYKHILLFGVFGSRIDHLLTNIFALDYLLNNEADVTIIEGNKEIIFLYPVQYNKMVLLPMKNAG